MLELLDFEILFWKCSISVFGHVIAGSDLSKKKQGGRKSIELLKIYSAAVIFFTTPPLMGLPSQRWARLVKLLID